MLIAHNLEQIQERIQAAALRAGRDPNEVTLVGVSKYYPVAAMLEAYQAGLRHFGENRVEEMQTKLPSFLQSLASDHPTIHMIGHLQSRKVAGALSWSNLIHSVDTLKLAQRIGRLAERDGQDAVPILLECNISGEASKSGFNLSDWPQDESKLNHFFEQLQQVAHLKRVRIEGLMTMAPDVDDPATIRPIFQSLYRLKAKCAETFPQIAWRHLSMGMTNDFEIAIEEGATFVRLGRAIFGDREND